MHSALKNWIEFVVDFNTQQLDYADISVMADSIRVPNPIRLQQGDAAYISDELRDKPCDTPCRTGSDEDADLFLAVFDT